MIHNTAIIDPKAKIHKNVSIGAYSLIGPNVEIGENTIIHSHVNISVNTKIGKENTIVFLTADHGVASEPSMLMQFNIPSGYFSNSEMIDKLTIHLRNQLNWPANDILAKDLILNYSNNQLFLNHQKYLGFL